MKGSQIYTLKFQEGAETSINSRLSSMECVQKHYVTSLYLKLL